MVAETLLISEIESCILPITHQINAKKEEQPDRQLPELAVQKTLFEIGKIFLPQRLTKSPQKGTADFFDSPFSFDVFF